MYKIILNVDGMHCGMCESFVNNVVRECADVKKVKSSARRGQTVIFCETMPDIEKIKGAIEQKGYRVLSSECEETVKRGLFKSRKNRE